MESPKTDMLMKQSSMKERQATELENKLEADSSLYQRVENGEKTKEGKYLQVNLTASYICSIFVELPPKFHLSHFKGFFILI